MNNEALSLASEINELETLLASIPVDNIIERMSLESRLAFVRAALAALPQQFRQKAKLTFRGKPVFGSHGIVADFGGKAAGAFSDAFAAVAAGLSQGLSDMGPIPNRDKNQLLITGTAIGSFGFEFELPAPELMLFDEDSKPQDAMEKIEALFRLAAEGTDDEVTEVIEEVHPRAVRKVYEFLELLVQQQAWCGLEFANHAFRYTDLAQIETSCSRLKADNIQEREQAYRGEFQGVLPAGRTFEFKLADQNGLIKGKIDRAVANADVLNREWLHKPVTVKLGVIQVGQGRPRYTLMSLDDVNG
ncbi:hypothetical protein AB4090_07345 [Acidithiobacillus sp. IBUN Pt1247-S3]|uniref:hypothetical protein n=1 Tax=Acidithiobacillus sp. IBUN Pt1247-S3 TaxID=3166642 RepID=UPI0034E5ADE7